MKADSLNAKDLFGKQVRYVVPTFQRPYVWNQDDQWEPFWDDVQHAADRYLEELDRAEDVDGSRAAAEQRTGRHFLGAVVVKQLPTSAAEVETREVIDGQQRLTTLQLLLDATEEVAREDGWDDVVFQVEDLILNNPRFARKDPDHIFKLWPTSTDQEVFRAVMTNGTPTKEFRDSKIVEAHEYFKLRVRDWVEQADTPDGHLARVEALQTALLGLLEIVVIDLGSSDDAFVIFETLNARGTPLLGSDLVKNFLLQTASRLGRPIAEVSASYWEQFDDDWWRMEIRQGRLRRPRLDTFLDYWLESELADEVASHEVFPRFKAIVDAKPAEVLDVAASMRVAAAVYRTIDTLDRYTRDGTFLYRWEAMDAGVLTPLLLWVFAWEPEELAPERRTRLLVALESYLVRRMINRMTTKQYNRMFLDALRELINAGPLTADDVLIEFLARQTAESQVWPSDAVFRQAFLDLPVYTLLTRGRVRVVLDALEDDMRGPKTEDEFVTRGKLTVEHVMPQAWSLHWPLPAGVEPVRAELDRNRLIQTFGNLTLATSSLNSTMSNHSWADKHKHLDANSVLLLNKWILRYAPQAAGWGEDDIRARSEALFERAVRIWPRP
ncbi:MAG: DUF262 domain-containing protein [Nocardioidaceae bacterium]